MQRWNKPIPLNPGLMQYPTGKWVAYTDHEQALAEKDLALAQANRHKEELFQKLAEKDREIEQLNRIISKWEDTYAGQKELLEQLRKELELLKADDAERCTLIRDMEEEEQRKDQEIEEARRTAEYWKAEHLAGNTKIEQQAKRLQELEEWQKIVTGTGTDQEAVVRMAATEYTRVAVQCWKEKCEQQAQQIAMLRGVLKELYALVQGECPSLLNEDSCGDAELGLKIEQAFKEVL